jgi:hypothetical protein
MATFSSINGQSSPEIQFKVLGAGSHIASDITLHRVPCTKLVYCHLAKQVTKINSVPSHGGHKILNYWLQDAVLTTKSPFLQNRLQKPEDVAVTWNEVTEIGPTDVF